MIQGAPNSQYQIAERLGVSLRSGPLILNESVGILSIVSLTIFCGFLARASMSVIQRLPLFASGILFLASLLEENRDLSSVFRFLSPEGYSGEAARFLGVRSGSEDTAFCLEARARCVVLVALLVGTVVFLLRYHLVVVR
ncbi:hypothetical protein sscle_05g045040 [Sclerotinia sclerotiorum 1980 UF-70]|uniref:Uncharacterized protein n=1 Tax=Sclerotinia sclerotiorum (strain ATCC 18683 / 1980 / Ss-1) TaxID=665079 RepID=A0A1D9Q465_SCLS1|nr:hypothetical protein sscle_05g045040 [Sclerotinia sclerotiorum 1980 UF-70]